MSKSKESVSYLRNALKSSCLRCCRGHLLEQLIQREERIAGGSRHGLPESRLPGQGGQFAVDQSGRPGSWWTGDWSSAGLAWWGRTRPPGMESYQQVWDQLQLVEQLGLSIFFWKLRKRILSRWRNSVLLSKHLNLALLQIEKEYYIIRNNVATRIIQSLPGSPAIPASLSWMIWQQSSCWLYTLLGPT